MPKLMSAEEYRAALETLGLTQNAGAELLGADPRTSRRWANAERDVPPPAARFLRYLILIGADAKRVGSILDAGEQVLASEKTMLHKSDILRDIDRGDLPGIEDAFRALVNWPGEDQIVGLDDVESALALLLGAAEALDHFGDTRTMPSDIMDTLRQERRGRGAPLSGGTYKAGGVYVAQHLEWWRPVFSRHLPGEA